MARFSGAALYCALAVARLPHARSAQRPSFLLSGFHTKQSGNPLDVLVSVLLVPWVRTRISEVLCYLACCVLDGSLSFNLSWSSRTHRTHIWFAPAMLPRIRWMRLFLYHGFAAAAAQYGAAPARCCVRTPRYHAAAALPARAHGTLHSFHCGIENAGFTSGVVSQAAMGCRPAACSLCIPPGLNSPYATCCAAPPLENLSPHTCSLTWGSVVAHIPASQAAGILTWWRCCGDIDYGRHGLLYKTRHFGPCLLLYLFLHTSFTPVCRSGILFHLSPACCLFMEGTPGTPATVPAYCLPTATCLS